MFLYLFSVFWVKFSLDNNKLRQNEFVKIQLWFINGIFFLNCNLLLAQLCTLWIALIEKLTEGLIYKWPCKFTWWHTYVCHIKREQKQFDSITVYIQQRRFLFLLCLYANLLMPATHIGIQYRYTAVQNSCPRAHISIWKQGFGNLKRLCHSQPQKLSPVLSHLFFLYPLCWSIFEIFCENNHIK